MQGSRSVALPLSRCRRTAAGSVSVSADEDQVCYVTTTKDHSAVWTNVS